MDQRLKNILDNFDAMQIGVDEPFAFHCTMCGKCCIHREDILLNPQDVYNLSRELKLTPEQMIEQYCEFYIGSDSRLPIVRLKPRGEIRRCPLLKDHKCSVHKAKPTVCAMFPIGRGIMMDRNQVTSPDVSRTAIQYIFTKPGCGDDSETHTVREWLGSFGIPIEDAFFIKWNRVIISLGMKLSKWEKKLGEKAMSLIWSGLFQMVYLQYDINRDFDPQFEANCRAVENLMADAADKWKAITGKSL